VAILHISFIPVSSQTLWLVCSFTKYLLETKGMFTFILDNENLKTISSYKAKLGHRVTPLFKQLCETSFAWENYIVNTNVYVCTCMVCCTLQ